MNTVKWKKTKKNKSLSVRLLCVKGDNSLCTETFLTVIVWTYVRNKQKSKWKSEGKSNL